MASSVTIWAENPLIGPTGDSIADEVVRIFVVRQCVVLGGEPMLKAVIVRLWLPRQVEASVQVPFAYMGSVVAVFLK